MPNDTFPNPPGRPGARGLPREQGIEDIFDAVEPAAAGRPPVPSLTPRAAPPMNLPGAEPPLERPVPPAPRDNAEGMPAAVGGVDDILSGVERSTPVVRGPRVGVNAPQPPAPFPTDEDRAAIAKQPPLFARRKFTILLVVLLALVVLGGGGFLAYAWWSSRPLTGIPSPMPTVTPGTVNPSPTAPTTPPTPAVVATPSPVPSEPEVDSDHDGLTDREEEELGTDKYSVDTDQDGLSDRDEVKVFNTDPKNPDTDGDGYADGSEVINGYNPKGPGKIKEVP
ncbi:MAG: hypothetical protein PHI63_06440 [Patescibacteria group bacterium]|nr:hypothetical protein [Patescibacteria group bacterium]